MGNSTADGDEDISGILSGYRRQIPGARDRLVAALLEDLRAMARRRLARARSGPDLLVQPTMLANDTMMKLLDQRTPIQSRDHLMGLATKFMGWILVDYHRLADRQVDAATMPESSSSHPSEESKLDDLISVHDALKELARITPQAAEVVALRTLSGKTIEEVALALGVGHATVERQYEKGLAWLRKRLGQ